MLNFVGIQALYIKEIKRFFKVYHQTVIAPIVNAVLFFSVFNFAFGERSTGFALPYDVIVATGLIIMSALQNSYSNTLSSISMSKVLGYLTDYIIPPLNKSGIFIAMALSAVTRGVVVALATFITMTFFVGFHIDNPLLLLFFLVVSCYLFACIGVIFGSISNSFDQTSAYTNYFVTPLLFLSGTFYSISSLPQTWQKVIAFNPVYYIIDGFRHAMTGQGDSNLLIGSILIVGISVVLTFISLSFLNKYYKVR